MTISKIFFPGSSMGQIVNEMISECCVNAPFAFSYFYSSFRQPSADFSLFLLLSRLFCSLLFATIYIVFWPILPKNVPDYSSLCDVLLAYYIRFENVHYHYINLIDLEYSISPLKSFGLSCCHYSQKEPTQSIKDVNLDRCP